MSSNYFQIIFIFSLQARVILTAVGADNWNYMAERHLILKSRTVETFSSRRWCSYTVGSYTHSWVCIFPHFKYTRRRHCLFWPSSYVYCNFWGDFVVIDGESKNENNLSTADLLHCHRLLVCMSFLTKVLVVLPFFFFFFLAPGPNTHVFFSV